MDPPSDVIQRIYIFRLLLGNQIDTRMSNFYYVIFIAFFSFLFSGVAHQISALYLQVDVSAGTPTYSWFSYPAKVSLFAATGKTGEKPPPPPMFLFPTRFRLGSYSLRRGGFQPATRTRDSARGFRCFYP